MKKKKSNTWLKVVLTIVLLEIITGGVLLTYKKIKQTPSDSISTKDKTVQALYQKIAYEDLEELDVMNAAVMLYYGYHNIAKKDIQSINCDVIKIEADTTGYQCNGMTTFIPSKAMEKTVQTIYGDVTVEKTNFLVDSQHYAYYDSENDGYVLYQKETEQQESPYNLKLVKAQQQDQNIILTTEVLDGIYGSVKATYKYTFEQDGKNYYLIKKEKVA